MRIIQTSYFNAPVKYVQPTVYKKTQDERDSYVKSYSSQAPSFRANAQNIYKKILESPTLSKKFMGLVSAAAATLIASAHFDNADDMDENTDLQNISQMFKNVEQETDVENLEHKLDEYKEENLKLKQKLNSLELQIKESKQQVEKQQVSNSKSAKEVLEEKGETTGLHQFEFPKKRGKLSELQKNLKQATNNLMLSEGATEQLSIICNNALQKGVLDNSSLVDFIDVISQAENKESAIQDYYEKLNKKDAFEAEFSLPKEQEKPTEADEDLLKRMGIKVVGKIDISNLSGKKRTGINPKQVQLDNNGSSFYLKSISDKTLDLVSCVSELLLSFQKEVYSQYKSGEMELSDTNSSGDLKPLRWKYNKELPQYVKAEDIEQEIEKVNTVHNNIGSKRHVNISEIDAEELANIINSDKRYSELFTMHGALRFIDRYMMNVEDSHDIVEQSKMILDTLVTVIEKAIVRGVEVDAYSSEGYYAPRMVIRAENFDENERRIFGVGDLYITFIEAQKTNHYVPRCDKKGVICTIFSK